MLVVIVALYSCKYENSFCDEYQVFINSKYTLIVKNDSLLTGSFCVYQTFSEQVLSNNLYSLAWFSKGAHPNTSVRFSWDTDYSFVWSDTEVLVPGARFIASEVKVVDPDDKNNNYALFSREDNAYFFKPTEVKGVEGNFIIHVDDTVPNLVASIGIGMSGQPVLAVSAAMNMTYTFQPHPTYWIVFGDFKAGEVLDLNIINPTAKNSFSQSKKIIFPTNIYEKTITFTKDNTWKE